MKKQQKIKRGGPRAGAGAKKKYAGEQVKFTISAPKEAVEAIKAFAKEEKKKYLLWRIRIAPSIDR